MDRVLYQLHWAAILIQQDKHIPLLLGIPDCLMSSKALHQHASAECLEHRELPDIGKGNLLSHLVY